MNKNNDAWHIFFIRLNTMISGYNVFEQTSLFFLNGVNLCLPASAFENLNKENMSPSRV